MSKKSSGFKRFDEYVKEASRAPFELPVTDDETIVVQAPTSEQMLKCGKAVRSGDGHAAMVAMCGESFPRVWELVKDVDDAVTERITEDMMYHFDLMEDITLTGPGGGEVTEYRPSRIRALMNQGYTLAGEADASRS